MAVQCKDHIVYVNLSVGGSTYHVPNDTPCGFKISVFPEAEGEYLKFLFSAYSKAESFTLLAPLALKMKVEKS